MQNKNKTKKPNSTSCSSLHLDLGKITIDFTSSNQIAMFSFSDPRVLRQRADSAPESVLTAMSQFIQKKQGYKQGNCITILKNSLNSRAPAIASLRHKTSGALTEHSISIDYNWHQNDVTQKTYRFDPVWQILCSNQFFMQETRNGNKKMGTPTFSDFSKGVVTSFEILVNNVLCMCQIWESNSSSWLMSNTLCSLLITWCYHGQGSQGLGYTISSVSNERI